MAYTAGDVLVRAEMQAASGLPADRIINDFAFRAAGAPSTTDVDNMFAAVDHFYRTAQSLGKAVGAFISRQVNRSATHTLSAYHIVAGDLGSPFREDPWLGPVAPEVTTGLPTEVAAVLSFHADLTGVVEESGSTRPKARRRGRIFVGPLTVTAVDTSTPPFKLDSGLNLTLREAAVDLMDEADADSVPWCVWSRSDTTLRPVVGGWTDDAPDTQRRRGFAATTRVVWG
jgi:hypothetical protein